jgi:pSer/pThr/pTyr-binding forkhead associated (FHA) protein
MSQNKTVFPGVSQNGDDFTPNYQQNMNGGSYSRTSNGRGNGTVYPGMENSSNSMPHDQQSNRNRPTGSGKPIVGFLYSISRTGVGEYWPLHIGQNIIGSSDECDVVLKEATVSQRHAILHINKMKKPEKTEATISDCQSTNGTMVNGNSVSVARPPECVTGDVITIGENYELLFILIDVKACGLTQAENFIAINDSEDSYQGNFSHSSSERETRNQQDFPPRFMGPDAQQGGQSWPSDSTVGMDPTANDGFSHGGTVGMTDF